MTTAEQFGYGVETSVDLDKDCTCQPKCKTALASHSACGRGMLTNAPPASTGNAVASGTKRL